MKHFVPFGTVSSREEFAKYRSKSSQLNEGWRELLTLIDPAGEFDLDEDVFFLAWELLGMQPGLSEQDMLPALVFVLSTLINLRQGSTCVTLGAQGGLERLLEAIIPMGLREEERWSPASLIRQIEGLFERGALDALLGVPGDFKPLIVEDGAVYHQRMLHYEDHLVEALHGRLSRQRGTINTDHAQAALAHVLEHAPGGFLLTQEQQYAALTALCEPFTIITGGPGTGKTSIVVTLLRLAQRLGVRVERIALAAPTGKAANRMQESISSQLRSIETPDEHDLTLLERLPSPQTLHRLLGYSRHLTGFQHHEYHRLNAEMVVVDEASMIDMFLMSQLVRAVRPDAHLVLLGDAEQLPSVDSGAVLRDLIPPVTDTQTFWAGWTQPPVEPQMGVGALARSVVRLTHSHRMREDDVSGRVILGAARKIRDGLSPLEGDEVRCLGEAEEMGDGGVSWLDMGERLDEGSALRGLQTFARAWFERRLSVDMEELRALETFDGDGFGEEETQRIHALWARVHTSRVLCLTRVFSTGTRALNEMFLGRARAAMGAVASANFLPGVPVMMLRNDYDREIFNGDQGLLMPVMHDGREELMVLFGHGGSFRAFSLDALRARLEVSYAMTVHKSQGSEFEHVGLVLPVSPLPILTREVLYTAATRSRASMLFVGSRGVLEHGAHATMVRESRIAQKLDREARS